MTTPHRPLKHFMAKPQTIQVLFAAGFAEAALTEVQSILNTLWYPSKLKPEVIHSKHYLLIRNIHLTTVYELLMRAKCIADIRLVIKETKTVSLLSFEKKLSEINWTLFLSQQMILKIKVDSIASQLFHETALRKKTVEILHPYVSDIVTGETSHETTTLFVNLNKNKLMMSISLAGQPLYKRGYKALSASAPLREDMAAACIQQMKNFLQKLNIDFKPDTFLIPFSGTGTFVFEYLLYNFGISPVFFRKELALQEMPFFKKETFEYLRKKAQTSLLDPHAPQIICVDNSKKVMEVYQQNRKLFKSLLKNSAILGEESLFVADFLERDASEYLPKKITELFIPMNPPYGLRLKKNSDTVLFYKNIARKINAIAQQHSDALVYGFILCPTEEAWSGFYNELRMGKKNTYHFTQGGLDIRVCQFVQKNAR